MGTAAGVAIAEADEDGGGSAVARHEGAGGADPAGGGAGRPRPAGGADPASGRAPAPGTGPGDPGSDPGGDTGAGPGVGTDPARGLGAAAAEALRLAALDPARTRTLSRHVLVAARRRGDWDAVTTAERALGVAAMSRNEIDVALRHLRAAVAAGRRAGSDRGLAEARMSLASALLLRGQPVPASRQIAAAVDGLDGVAAARARVQQAAILQELGRDEPALAALRRALPVLRRADDAQWAVRALSNRGLLHADRRAFAAAESDLAEALRLCAEHGLDLPAGYAEQNLGCVCAARGEVPAALRHFDAAERRYREFDIVEPSLLLDRAEVLLSVRLLEEARAAAAAAVAACARQHRDVHLPQARLLLSTVALVQGEPDVALAAAAAAVREFRRLGRHSAAVLARYARLQARLALSPAGVGPARLAAAATELDAAGWRVPALEARVLAGRAALERGRVADARRELARAGRARRTGPADARARAWLAEALLRRADGRRAAAVSALRAGLRVVEEHQATLGATELRAHVSVHRGALARWGLRMAVQDGDAPDALWWAERGRAGALLVRPARPPRDPSQAADLADLRATVAEIERARATGAPDAALVHRQVMLERRVRDRSRTEAAGGEGGSRADGQGGRAEQVRALAACLGPAGLVEFVELDGALHALTLAGGRARLHRLGAPAAVTTVTDQLGFALRRSSGPSPRRPGRAQAVAAALRSAADRADALLLRPLARELGDRPLVLVPSESLRSVPWSLLASCRGRPVSVCPSAALWRAAAAGGAAAGGTAPGGAAEQVLAGGAERPGDGAAGDVPGRVVVVAGPGLPGAEQEAAAVARLHPGAVLLRGRQATTAAVLRAGAGAGVLHLAAHGRLRADNPQFSAVLLHDGPATVYDLERIAPPPRHVVLAACDTGRGQAAGEEVLGVAAALLAAGTATVVAPVVAVPDAATVPLMRRFHRLRLAGRSAAAALAEAQVASGADPEQAAAAGGFVCLGAG